MAYTITPEVLKLMGDAIDFDEILRVQLEARTKNEPMLGLPGGEGATRLEVHLLEWKQVDPCNEAPQKRDEWSPGPWMEEADALWFKEGDAYGVVLRQPELGSLCGYVGVPPNNPAYGVSVDGGNLPEAPGGITAAGENHLIDRALGLPLGLHHWLGFDTCHAGDVVPKLLAVSGPHSTGISSKATYKDLRFVLHHTELLRRRLCIPRELLTERVWAHAFAFAGEINEVRANGQKWAVLDLDTTPPAGMNVRVDRSDVREVIALEWSEQLPGVTTGHQYEACGVFCMHSGALMLLHAGAANGWSSGYGGAKLTRDPDVLQRELLQMMRNMPSAWQPQGGCPMQRALQVFKEHCENGGAKPPTRAELQAVSAALAEAENAFDVDD